jgi:hypothetical protein
MKLHTAALIVGALLGALLLAQCGTWQDQDPGWQLVRESGGSDAKWWPDSGRVYQSKVQCEGDRMKLDPPSAFRCEPAR